MFDHYRVFWLISKTGPGHGTQHGCRLGLSGEDYLTTETSTVREKTPRHSRLRKLNLAGQFRCRLS
ncbi:MAG: hypothetical protein R3C26_10265 [Calditrichia bacterium]